MSYYFSLQFKRLNRFLIEFGVAPLIAYPLFVILFIFISLFIFVKASVYASWVYTALCIIIIESVGQQDRTQLLQSLFNRSHYFKIRLIENALVAIPFISFLLYKQAYYFATGLLFISLCFAFIPNYRSFQLSMPTPFKRRPFEFTAGFRSKVLYIPFILFVLAKSLQVGNANLAVAVLALSFLMCLTYYGTIEDPYFVWIHNKTAQQFLLFKIKQGLINSTLLSLPIFLVVAVVFSETLATILLIQGLGYILVITIILAKYSAFPSNINLPQIILFIICLWLPPMLLIIIPLFYSKAINKLKPILS